MKQEIPKKVVIGVVALVGIIALIAIGSQFFGGGPGKMTDEEFRRADAQARVGTSNMGNYVPNGVPGAPPAASEADARAAHAAQNTGK